MGNAQLLLLGDLAERTAVGRIVENRVISESCVSAWGCRDLAFYDAGCLVDHLATPDDGQGADEARGARGPRPLGQSPEDFRKSLGIGRVRTQKPRGAHARLAVER